MYVNGRKAEQADQTRRQLVAVGRRLFTERGYAATATEDVVQQAGVTRGALYYHFRDKQALFRAVVEDVNSEIMGRLREIVITEPDPWLRLRNGMQAYLDYCIDPAVQRIVLVDAPAVLGWSAWREMDKEFGLGQMRIAIAALIEAGVFEPQPVDPIAHLLMAALGEAGLLIAQSGDVRLARRDVGAAIDRLLQGLREDTR